jgi:NitT/TauT family transport system ATP-binding protein
MTAVSLSGVSVHFWSPAGDIVALQETSLDVESHEIVSVVGPSGCGKTTLLDLVAGFLAPTEGRVLIDGVSAGPPSADRAVVFQSDAVFPWLTVRQNLEYGPRVRGAPLKTFRDRVDHFLERVGLVQFADAYPKTLSGGMRKRVDIARAYVSNPQVLLMDEPFGALDVFTKESMWRVLGELLAEERKTVIFVTHDIEEAIIVADRVVAMTPRPARVAAERRVSYPFPRNIELRASPEFQKMRQELAALITEQVN